MTINIFGEIYKRIDLTQNIRLAQKAGRSITGKEPQLVAAILVGFIVIFAWFTQFYVDWIPSYKFGSWLVHAVGATGYIAIFAAVIFTAVPTASESVAPMLNGKLWFMNFITNVSIIFDFVTDYPTISAVIDDALITSGSATVLIAVIHPYDIVIVKVLALIVTSLLVQIVAISLLFAEIELIKSIFSTRRARQYARRGG